MATNLLNCKHRSPRVLLTPLRLPSVSSLYLPGVSCKKNCLLPLKLHFLLFTLVLQVPNLSQFLTRVGLQSPFVSLTVLTEGFLRYPRAMLGDV